LFDPCCDWYAYGSGWTLVQGISTCPAGQVLDGSGSSCTACESHDTVYAGRCSRATSKYGACVCAKCKDGYSGDRCEIEPAPVYATVCTAFETSHQCENMSGNAKWLGRATVDAGTCQADCKQYAESEGLEGCCFQFSHPTQRNCRFFAGQQSATSGSATKAASVCTRQRVN